MSLGTTTFSPLLCGASGSSSSYPRWRSRSGCAVLNAIVQQQSDEMVCLVSVLKVENFPLEHAGGGRQICAWTTSSFTPVFAGQKMSKGRSRVHCQLGAGGSSLTVEDWKKKLPAKRKALYSHSLPCIEAWLHCLGFVQVSEDRAVWDIERTDWHAQLLLDVTDLYIRYLKKGPGNLDRDIERKFSYALSREDLENAILGGP